MTSENEKTPPTVSVSQETIDQYLNYVKADAEERRVARVADWPYSVSRIEAVLDSRSLGGFVLQAVVAAAIARRFPDGSAVAIFEHDMAYRSFVVSCLPVFKDVYGVSPSMGPGILLDWFDRGIHAPVKNPDQNWYAKEFNEPHLLLVPPMLNREAALLADVVTAPFGMHIPPGAEAGLMESLKDRGLDPGRWFAAVHLRTKAEDPRRNVDPETYLPMIRDIIDNQGGHVVRVGEFNETSFPETDGLIDLTRSPVAFPDQAFAISRARYFIGTDSGPLTLASGFRVPAAATNVIGCWNRVWNADSVVLAKTITPAGGESLGSREAYERGFLGPDGPPADAAFADNGPEDLIAVAGEMLAATSDSKGWRTPVDDAPPPETGIVPFPLPVLEKPTFRFWGD